MNIGIIDPHTLRWFFRKNSNKIYNVHGYAIEFIKKYEPHIYISDIKKLPLTIIFFYSIKENLFNYKIHFSKKEFLKNIDVLIYLNGSVYPDVSLFKDFHGLKIYHIMDPQYKAKELNEFLNEAKIDFLLGYNSYDKHSDFVRKMYPNFKGKFIGIPFGYADVWETSVPFDDRINKALLTGTVETFNWIKSEYDIHKNITDYVEYYSNSFSSMHEIRYQIAQNIFKYSEFIDSKIQLNRGSYKNPSLIKDVVGEFNKYKFFINDESLLNFCPIRTYEGIAAGCVMIAHRSSCYEEWGFKDGENGIFFNSIEEIPALIKSYNNDFAKLAKIQTDAENFVRFHYSHKKVSELLFNKIFNIYKSVGKK